MPTPAKVAGSQLKLKRYPFGVGDGTRNVQREDNQPNDMNVVEADQANNDEPEQANSALGGLRGDEANRGVCSGVDDGLLAQEQVINVLPDQLIRFITPAAEAKQQAKKEHPQERIKKFWSNFEPEYLGDITQILPDTIAEIPEPTPKKASSTQPKAVKSYDVARASCIKSVNRIVRECRTNNQKYTDLHFDLERDLKITENRDCLYGLMSWDNEKNPGDVKRVTDIFEHPQFFKDGADFDDIVQGSLGDCWFLAGLSAITANQELLRKVCVKQDQDVGVYGFVFHRDGDWHPCIIDDKLYLSAPSYDESGDTVLEQYGVRQQEQEKIYVETQQKGSKALFFASCRDENETWVPLLEKAYAKAHGDFTALDGGQVGEALEDLTGGITTEIYTTNILNKEDFWRDLSRIGKDFIFSCHVSIYAGWRLQEEYEASVRGRRLKGIMERHAYSVLATYEGYGQKLVKIRNPWGETEWTGAWSDGSKEWNADWLQRLEHKFGDDGVFWMSYEDMLKRYKYMDRTRLFGPEWYIAQEWTRVQVPWNSRDYQTTTFSIDVSENTDAVIALSQLDDRYFRGLEGPYRYTLSFRVQKSSEGEEDEDEDDYFARSPINYELSRSTNVEVHLEKGKYTVLFKVEATKYDVLDIEKVIRHNISRRDKVTQMATLYDLAFKKGKLPEDVLPKPEETATARTQTISEPEKKEENPEKDKPAETTEEASKPNDQTPNEKKDTPTDATDSQPQPSPTDPAQEPTTSKPPKFDSSEPPAVMSPPPTQQGVSSTGTTGIKPPPDDTDPDRNPWNASCVVGLRVYSKLEDLKVQVVRPGDKSVGVTLDRDDIAKSALVEAENAAEKQQQQQQQVQT